MMSEEWAQIEGPKGSFKAYVARPSGAPKAAVVVIQEIFGVNAVIRGKADWLAGNGFLAVAPDLFWRIEPGITLTDQSEAEWKRAFELFGLFDVDGGLEDIAAAIAWARGQGAAKVGAVGYCLGGLLAYLTACRTSVNASVGYYGVSIEQRLSEAAGITHPLMLHVAGKDQFVKPDAQAAMASGLAGHPKVTLHTYQDQDHAFTREGGAHYDKDAALIADGRTIDFFHRHLG